MTPPSTGVDWNKQFERLVKYAKTKYGYGVIVKESIDFGIIDSNNFKITIKQIYKKDIMTFLLLHELGHVIQSLKTKQYKKRIEEVLEVVSRSSLSFRTTVLYEEMDAWNEAYDLAKRLSIPLDRRKFESYKSRCLKTYMIWVLELNRQSRTVVQKAEQQNQNDLKVHYEVVEEIIDLEDNNNNNLSLASSLDEYKKAVKNDIQQKITNNNFEENDSIFLSNN